MKKVLLALILAMLFIPLRTRPALALCRVLTPFDQCGFNDYPCFASGKSYCCTEGVDECSALPSPTQNPSGVTCSGGAGINTAIGCIHVLSTPEAFLSDILKWAVGIGGGIAFLLIIYAGFMIMTSSGNPERLKAGQELLTSAISGLILLVFSIFILKSIGIDILRLCKFGFGPACY